MWYDQLRMRMRTRYHTTPNTSLDGLEDTRHNGEKRRGKAFALQQCVMPLLYLFMGIMAVTLYDWLKHIFGVAPHQNQTELRGPVLVSYSYFEKDRIQKQNFEFFLAAGTQPAPKGLDIHYSFVINGDECSPCSLMYQKLEQRSDVAQLQQSGILSVWESPRYTLIKRTENIGMDIAAHNMTLEYQKWKGTLKRYRYFMFLNSSTKGPFYPKYVPHDWYWTQAYTSKITNKVKAVGASLTCLPEVDTGGPGPRLESWAYATDDIGLNTMIKAEVFHVRECKICVDGIIVKGEYGITVSLLTNGYQIRTLMSLYGDNIDWNDPKHWHCNNNVHPSRHGSYQNISHHPYETVFVKSSWHVADPYTTKYATWKLQQIAGIETTQGRFDEKFYQYAISYEAQLDPRLEECYKAPFLRGKQ